jgi:hypothetical protein
MILTFLAVNFATHEGRSSPRKEHQPRRDASPSRMSLEVLRTLLSLTDGLGFDTSSSPTVRMLHLPSPLVHLLADNCLVSVSIDRGLDEVIYLRTYSCSNLATREQSTPPEKRTATLGTLSNQPEHFVALGDILSCLRWDAFHALPY